LPLFLRSKESCLQGKHGHKRVKLIDENFTKDEIGQIGEPIILKFNEIHKLDDNRFIGVLYGILNFNIDRDFSF
jgi:hypothetical protein